MSVTVTHLTENVIDVQFADETSTIEELMLEILQYTTACLNSRIKCQAGIFIAGVEGIPRVVGLPLNERASDIEKLKKSNVSSRISVTSIILTYHC